MKLPKLKTKIIESDPYRSVVLYQDILIFAECNGSQKQEVADEIALRCNHHKKLIDALESLMGMAANFPAELHAKHPDVVNAQAILYTIKKESKND